MVLIFIRAAEQAGLSWKEGRYFTLQLINHGKIDNRQNRNPGTRRKL